jgi:hypothetical protein
MNNSNPYGYADVLGCGNCDGKTFFVVKDKLLGTLIICEACRFVNAELAEDAEEIKEC